jgi:RNA polymerase sigma factor (sigma-70 family)
MPSSSAVTLLDPTGHPFTPPIEQVLTNLIPRLERASPVFRDDGVLTEILEEAGRKIVRREEQPDPIENLEAYAWVTVRTVATSWLRHGTGRLAQQTLGPTGSAQALATLPTPVGTADQIEQRILLRQVLARLTPEERLICVWKQQGWSSREIAARRGTSVDAVNMLFLRTKRKMRELLGVNHEAARPAAAVAVASTPSDSADAARVSFSSETASIKVEGVIAPG